MKVKIMQFPDGKIAVSTGLRVEINKNKPILEEEIKTDEDSYRKILEKPTKFKFSKNAKKIIM